MGVVAGDVFCAWPAQGTMAVPEQEAASMSPPCGPFSRLLNCTRGFLQSEKGQEKLRQGREMLKFFRDVAIWQLKRGRYFLLEHPSGASSWQEETLQELEQYLGVYKTKIHQCAATASARQIRLRS